MKLDDLIKKEGLTLLKAKKDSIPSPLLMEPRRERPWLENKDIETNNNEQSSKASSLDGVEPGLENSIALKNGVARTSQDIQSTQNTVEFAQSSKEKTEDKRETNGGQKRDEWRTNRRQIRDNETATASLAARTEDKWETERGTNGRTKEGQKEDNSKIEVAFSCLVGLQRKITIAIYSSTKITRTNASERMSLEHLADLVQTTESSVKKTIQRLKSKRVLKIFDVKLGRGGWVSYSLSESIHKAILLGEIGDNWRTIGGQIEDKRETNRGTKQGTTVSSSSSSSLDLTLNRTSTSEKKTELIDGWQNIHFSELSQIGFGKAHIQQLAERRKRTPEEVQTSIDAFAFDLTVNQKAPSIKNPLGYFMGILHRGPYAVPVNFEAPEVRQRKAYLAAEERKNAQLRELDERILQSEFEKWDRALELKEKLELAPVPEAVAPGGAAHKSILKEYFRENLWPVIENKIHESSS